MRKIFSILLLISFLVLAFSVIGLALHLPPRSIFKEIHSISGWAFIILTAIHIYTHRKLLKAMMKK